MLPIDLPQRRKPETRAEHEAEMIARGQIEIIDYVSERVSRMFAWLRGRRP